MVRKALQMAMEGMNQNEIAGQLKIRADLLSRLLKFGYDDLGCANMAQAIAIGMRDGWLKINGKRVAK